MARVRSRLFQSPVQFGFIGFLIGTIWVGSQLQAQARPLGTPPGTARSGAVRGGCTTDLLQKPNTLIALVDSEVAQTRKPYPTFLFFMPISRSEKVNSAKLVIVEEEKLNTVDDLDASAIVVPLPQRPGIVSVTLPQDHAPLEVSKRYFWAMTIVCSATNPSANLSVTGLLERVDQPNTLATISAAPSMPKVPVNSVDSNDAWYEWVAKLAKTRSVNYREWNALLDHFGLNKFERSPIVELTPQS